MGETSQEGLSDLTVRLMTLEDLDAVLAIEVVSFSSPWSRNSFVSELTLNPRATYIVAEMDGEIVGYAGMWVIFDEAHVTTIAVKPEARRKGIGETLMRSLAMVASLAGAARATLEVRVSNIRAQSLYEKLGFKKAGLRKRYYQDNGEDAIIMWKEGLDDLAFVDAGAKPLTDEFGEG